MSDHLTQLHALLAIAGQATPTKAVVHWMSHRDAAAIEWAILELRKLEENNPTQVPIAASSRATTPS